MSFDRQNGNVVFECDCCPETFTGTRDFFESKDMLMDEGWLIRKYKGEWFHLCPEHKTVDLSTAQDVDDSWLEKLL